MGLTRMCQAKIPITIDGMPFNTSERNRTLVASRATGYLQIDNKFLRALGKVAAPFVQAKADKETGQLLRVFARASRAIEENDFSGEVKIGFDPTHVEVTGLSIAEAKAGKRPI